MIFFKNEAQARHKTWDKNSLIFVSLSIRRCQTGKPALPYKLNESLKCALILKKIINN